MHGLASPCAFPLPLVMEHSTRVDFLSGLNPEQQNAVAHVDGPLLILAGAGSGKTRVITNRICHLITAHQIPGPAILAVTFTNKAAAEMRERVQKNLGGFETYNHAPVLATFHPSAILRARTPEDRERSMAGLVADLSTAAAFVKTVASR